MRTIIAILFGLLMLTTSAMAETGMWYRATLDIDGINEIPFLLKVPASGEPGVAIVRNAGEDIEVAHTWQGAALTLDFPHFDSRIVAHRDSETGLSGSWTKTRSAGNAVLAFEAHPASDPDPLGRFGYGSKRAHHHGAVTTRVRYAMDFEDSGVAEAVLEFNQAWSMPAAGGVLRADPGNVVQAVRGTILTPTGDYRFLSGVYELGKRLRLSVFDGAHAFLFTADLDPTTGDLTNGHFYSGNHWHETFTARRLKEGETYELPDPFSEVSLKPGVTRLGLPKLSEPPYAGNPTIVQIFGTWCPNCHDEAPVLVDLYKKHHADGLQILSLAYEYTDDAERSARQIQRYKDRFGATWEFVAAGVNDKAKTAATLPALSAIKSYPTTIWINPDGTVRAIHSGFAGPATGEAYTKTLEHFEQKTAEILGH